MSLQLTELNSSISHPSGLNHAFSRLARGVIESANAILQETSADVEEQANKLGSLFSRLNDNSEVQTADLSSLVAKMTVIEHDGTELNLVEVPKLLQKTLRETSERLLILSKQGVSLIYSLDDIMGEIKDLNGCIREIDGINRQTRLLSLNAQIEAARLGDAAGGFHVVSTEILSISKRIDSLSKRMLTRTESITTKISNVIDSIRSEYEELSRIGALDLTAQLDAQSGLELLIDAMVERNFEVQQVLEHSKGRSEAIASDIREVVIGMQFQDRMTQRTEAVVGALKQLQTFIATTPGFLEDEAGCDSVANEIVNAISISEVRKQFEFDLLGIESADDEDDDLGDIELF